jgi:hypothetical protein
MNYRSVLISFAVSFVLIFLSSNGWSWSVDTHKILTEAATKNSVLHESRDSYLNNRLGFKRGIKEGFMWTGSNWTVLYWLQEGSVREDDFFPLPPRFSHHFHNPLKQLHDWDKAGLDDSEIIIDWAFGSLWISSLLWAHRDSNDWSWQRTRDYFYTALTAATEEQRQEYFARTFRGLGHQIHLLQDKAVPAHVRNDSHPLTKNLSRSVK